MDAQEELLRERLHKLIKSLKILASEEALNISKELDKIIVADLKAQIINQSKNQLNVQLEE